MSTPFRQQRRTTPQKNISQSNPFPFPIIDWTVTAVSGNTLQVQFATGTAPVIMNGLPRFKRGIDGAYALSAAAIGDTIIFTFASACALSDTVILESGDRTIRGPSGGIAATISRGYDLAPAPPPAQPPVTGTGDSGSLLVNGVTRVSGATSVNIPDGSQSGDWCIMVNADAVLTVNVNGTGISQPVANNTGAVFNWTGTAWIPGTVF